MGESAAHGLALSAGLASTLLFGVQFLPQIYLNYQRKSVKGWSVSGTLIKFVGACFLLVNAWYTAEALPVQLFGLVNVAQILVLMVQIATYNAASEETGKLWAWLAFPLLPYALISLFPATVVVTSLVKPACMVISHIPQLHLCYSQKSVQGLSMMTQHCNMLAGLLGAYMCAFIPPKAAATYLLYSFAILQAVTTYAAAFAFGTPADLVSIPDLEIAELRADASHKH